MRIEIYDTTLRDGAQQEGLSLTLDDKLRVVEQLDRLGVDVIEGGWPGSNPKDEAFFRRVARIPLQHARIAAFGSTCRSGCAPEDDLQVQALLAAETEILTIVGKASAFHVEEILGTTRDENLRMIRDTVRYLRASGRRVILDAEHFFDGYREDPRYALQCLDAAASAGADTVVLCDTNGGAMPWEVEAAVRGARDEVGVALGIHGHNDAGMAVANSVAAVRAGAIQVQGTINGYGERCGNANLTAAIPTLVLKMGASCRVADRLAEMTRIAETLGELADKPLDPQSPYVGASAFAHKGGLHVDAVAKHPDSYQHVDPEVVGNRGRIVVSELSGGANVVGKASEFGFDLHPKASRTRSILDRIKRLEYRGFQFEGADASVELIVRRSEPDYVPPFELAGFYVLIREKDADSMVSEATTKVRIGTETVHTASEGNGPVHALDLAVRKALVPAYPEIADVELSDYRVRILDGDAGTAARTRVLITSTDGARQWSTVGCGTNVIEASWIALADALEYALIGKKARQIA